MNKRTIAIFLTVLLATLNCAVADDILSMATGIKGIEEIARSPEWQLELEVSPVQLAELQKLLDSKGRRSAILSATPDEDLLSVDSPRANRTADRLFEASARKILTEAQLNARRVKYLRQKFPYPLSALNTELLLQVGLGKNEARAIAIDLQPHVAKIAAGCNAARVQAVDELFRLFPKTQDKFAKCFGRELLPPSAATKSDFGSESIGVFKEDGGVAFLSAAQLYVLPAAVKPISDTQLHQMMQLRREINLKQAKDRAFNPDQAVDLGIQTILDEAQRKAIAHSIHLTLLSTDLHVLATPSVLRFLEIDKLDVPKGGEPLR